MSDDFLMVSFVFQRDSSFSNVQESPLQKKKSKNTSELKQLHNLELLVRNEESFGFVGFYLKNQR